MLVVILFIYLCNRVSVATASSKKLFGIVLVFFDNLVATFCGYIFYIIILLFIGTM